MFNSGLLLDLLEVAPQNAFCYYFLIDSSQNNHITIDYELNRKGYAGSPEERDSAKKWVESKMNEV